MQNHRLRISALLENISTVITEGGKRYINITQQGSIGAVGIWGTFERPGGHRV